jgi:hypothetical protein
VRFIATITLARPRSTVKALRRFKPTDSRQATELHTRNDFCHLPARGLYRDRLDGFSVVPKQTDFCESNRDVAQRFVSKSFDLDEFPAAKSENVLCCLEEWCLPKKQIARSGIKVEFGDRCVWTHANILNHKGLKPC